MDWLETLVLSLAVSSMSMTLTKAKVFQGFRSLVRWVSPWLGKLVSCPYCMSHWLAFLAVLWYRPVLVTSQGRWVDLLVSVFVVVALASFSSGLIFRAFAGMTDEES